MSSDRGARIAGKRAFNASTIAAVSSTESVVCVRKARLAVSGRSRSTTSATVSINVMDPAGTWPKVPITSGWPAWPMKRMCRPSSISRCACR